MGLREIVVACALVLPGFIPIGTHSMPVSQYKIPKWKVPQGLDKKVLDEAQKLGARAFLLFTEAQKKKKAGNDRESFESWEKAIALFDDTERILLEQEKIATGPIIDSMLAPIYTIRSRPSTRDRNSDRKLAIPRWENILDNWPQDDRNSPYFKDGKEQLFACRYSVATDAVITGQALFEYGTDPKETKILQEELGIKTIEQAVAAVIEYHTLALSHLQILSKERPDQPDLWHMLALCHFRLNQLDESLIACREYIKLQPHNFRAYRNVAKVYLAKKTIWNTIKEAKFVPHPNARKLFAKAAAEVLDEAREALGTHPIFLLTNNEDSQDLADFFYETSRVRCELERRKSKPDYTEAITDLFMAGSAEFSIALKNRDEAMGKRIAQRVAEEYDRIGSNIKDTPSVAENFRRMVFADRTLATESKASEKIAIGLYEELKALK